MGKGSRIYDFFEIRGAESLGEDVIVIEQPLFGLHSRHVRIRVKAPVFSYPFIRSQYSRVVASDVGVEHALESDVRH